MKVMRTDKRKSIVWTHSNPLVVAWVSDVVEVIIDTSTSSPVPLVDRWEPSNVSPTKQGIS